MIHLATFVLAFCSIVYELLLGQALAAFLGNTVLRYSVTIGLYMLSMGLGAMAVRKRVAARPLYWLQAVELALSLLGGLSVISLFVLQSWGASLGVISAVGHTMIVVIGVLTGLELPLLIELARRVGGRAADRVLGVDYIGAFAGTLVFAFYFYPSAGLVPTAFAVATLNAATGLFLVMGMGHAAGGKGVANVRIGALQALLLVAVATCLARSERISEFCVDCYLGVIR